MRSLRKVVRFIIALRIKKKRMTKGDLYQIHVQLETWKHNKSIALLYLNRVEINKFYELNTQHVNALVKEIDKLHAKYFVINDKNIIQETKNHQPMYKHDVSPKDFEAELSKLFSSEISHIVLL